MVNFKEYLFESKAWYGYEHIIKMKVEASEFASIIKKLKLSDDHIYFEPKYDYKKHDKQLQIKITNIDTMKKILDKTPEYQWEGDGTNYKSQTKKIKLYLSGGMRGSGILSKFGKVDKNPTTEQQESGTIEYIKLKIENTSDEEIRDSLIKSIGFEFNEEWIWNFEEHFKAISSFLGISILSKSNIYLDSKKNDSNILLKLAKKFGLKDSKDNWNPSDIWIMNIKSSQIEKDTKDFINLEQFNGYLKDKFMTKEIVGVSLKKINFKKSGKYTVVGDSERPTISNLRISDIIYKVGDRNFILKTHGDIDGFNIRAGYKASSIESEKNINIFLEGRMKNSKVQLGAISKMLIRGIFSDNEYDIDSYKTKIFSEPRKYFNKFKNELHGTNISIIGDAPEEDIKLKYTTYLLFFMYVIHKLENKNILEQFYFSSTKMNTFSSIHLKVGG